MQTSFQSSNFSTLLNSVNGTKLLSCIDLPPLPPDLLMAITLGTEVVHFCVCRSATRSFTLGATPQLCLCLFPSQAAVDPDRFICNFPTHRLLLRDCGSYCSYTRAHGLALVRCDARSPESLAPSVMLPPPVRYLSHTRVVQTLGGKFLCLPSVSFTVLSAQVEVFSAHVQINLLCLPRGPVCAGFHPLQCFHLNTD